MDGRESDFYSHWAFPQTTDSEFGYLDIQGSVNASQDVSFSLEKNQSIEDVDDLPMAFGFADAQLSIRTDDAPKEIYGLWGNGPATIPDSDGEPLRINLFNGLDESSWNTIPEFQFAKLRFEIQFCLTTDDGPGSGDEGFASGGGSSSIPYLRETKTVPYLVSMSEIFIHPTIGENPNGDLNGVSINNFEHTGDNIVYVRVLTYLDANLNKKYDNTELLLSATPFTSLRVKLDKDESWGEDF